MLGFPSIVTDVQSNFTLFMAHYGDLFWTEGALLGWDSLGPMEVAISFPPQWPAGSIAALTHRWKVAYPNLSIQSAILPHGQEVHASLDHLKAIEFLRARFPPQTPGSVVADPDFWILKKDRTRGVLSAVDAGITRLAADHNAPAYSHPCFAAFPSRDFMALDLAVGMEELRHDFGRLWVDELRLCQADKAAARPIILEHSVQTRKWGAHYYPNLGGLHFSSQSFVGSKWTPMSKLPWRRWGILEPRRLGEALLRGDQFDYSELMK